MILMKNIYRIISISILAMVLGSCSSVYSYSVKRHIEKEYTDVREVEIIPEDWNNPRQLRIFFKDGRKLFLSESYFAFCLNAIGDYGFDVYYQNASGSNVWYDDSVPIGLIGQEAKIPVKRVYDVIENYASIYAYVGSLRDANDEVFHNVKEKYPHYWVWYSDIDLGKIEYRDYTYIIFKCNSQDKT